MLIYLLPVLLGVSLCLQGTVNGLLSGRVGLPLTMMITSGVVFACSLAWMSIARLAGAGPIEHNDVPWTYLTGGLLGVVVLSSAAVAFPRLGAGTTTVVAVASQVVAALVVDRMGAAAGRIPLSMPRLIGLGLVVVGVALVLGTGAKVSTR